MKTTISGRPNKHLTEYPCLMVDKQNKDLIVLVADNQSHYQITVLTEPTIGQSYEYDLENLEETFEVFTGKITIEND